MTNHDQLIEEMMRRGARIGDAGPITAMYQAGRRAADEYWSRSGWDFYPLTRLRRLLRTARSSTEYLEARYGFYQRLREYGNMSFDEIESMRDMKNA